MFIRLCIGYFLAVVYALTDAISFSCVQALQGTIPDLQLSSIRLFIQCMILYAVSKWSTQIHLPDITDFKWMAIAIFGFSSMNFGLYGSTKCLPLAVHASLFQLVNFLVMAFLLWLCKSERPGGINLLAISLCIIGIILTSQPTFLFQTNFNHQSLDFHTNSTNISETQTEILHATPYCYFLLILGSSGTAIGLFSLGIKLAHINIFNGILWLSLGSFWVTTMSSLYLEQWNVMFIFRWQQVLLVLGHSVLACAATVSSIEAISFIGGLRVVIVSSLMILFELFSQFYILQKYQPGHHNSVEVIGVCFVVAGIALPAVLEMVKQRYFGPPSLEEEDLMSKYAKGR